MLPLVAFPQRTGHGGQAVTLADLPGRRRVLLAERTAHVLLEQSGRCLQLAIMGEVSLSARVELLLGLPVDPDKLEPTLAAVMALGCLLGGKELPRSFDGPARNNRRLDQALRALDGWRSGLSHRQIAIELFGQVRVEADWGRGADHLKSRIRRLIGRSRWLMDGGYLTLLR